MDEPKEITVNYTHQQEAIQELYQSRDLINDMLESLVNNKSPVFRCPWKLESQCGALIGMMMGLKKRIRGKIWRWDERHYDNLK